MSGKQGVEACIFWKVSREFGEQHHTFSSPSCSSRKLLAAIAPQKPCQSSVLGKDGSFGL